MSNTLKITIVQSELYWENAEENLKMFSEKIAAINTETNLIILPEMFSTGFSMNPADLAEPAGGRTFKWMVSQAKNYNTAITGSVIISENDHFFNRLFFIYPDGHFEKYDKKHTFTFAGENEVYANGTERLVLDYKGWKICPLICYDLRFPVWARNTEDYDLLIYVANWPKVRTLAWDTLLQARAIENMAYCVGVNRVGVDGNIHEYVGHSAVYDPVGKNVSTCSVGEFTETIILEKKHIQENRNRFRFLNDRDSFKFV
ncbi:amidohydrolase [Aequorivita sp. H23M31]|uniref:Omega-amidase YafV n=1 Tax=Aequorivita ciconiae TaxID=2494375 RepID=A0A410G4K6_9FLAO|nr:amidohydrolase [Aequorivita sp. H23M31]QAA82155.1 amidohydrolase [Aequorivita sp. H23M31]